MRLGPALVLGLAMACAGSQPGQAPAEEDLCAGPDTDAEATLCAVRQARRVAVAEGPEAVEQACRAITDEDWRDDCVFQAAEVLALEGEVEEGLELCAGAGQFAQRCRARVVWTGAGAAGVADPVDPEAAVRVGAYVEQMRPLYEGARGEGFLVVRAAAWHGVYAGRGLADPTAARGAGAQDARYARTAFAWEAVRLLEDRADTQAVIDEVLAAWRGQRPPPRGGTLAPPCWELRLFPNAEGSGTFVKPAAPMYPGGVRAADEDPETDLLIATLHATWTHGEDLDPDLVDELRGHPSPAVQRTAARFAGLMADDFDDLDALYPEAGRLRHTAISTRRATRRGRTVRPLLLPGRETCR